MTLNLTVLAIPKFPARVAAGIGMAITKLNGIWTFSFAGNTIPPQTVSDPAETDVIVEMPDGSLGKVSVSSFLQLRSYTVVTLPSASVAGQLIYVSDGTANKRLAVSDATNWRWPDGTIVS